MARAYASFVLRCWRLDAGERRITVEHIQSGERVAVPSVAAAVEWVCIHLGNATAEQIALPDHEGAACGQQVEDQGPSALTMPLGTASGERKMEEETCR